MTKFCLSVSRLVISLCLLVFHAAVNAACLGDKTSTRTFSVHVLPHLGASHMHAHWAPFLEELGRRSGQCFELVIPRDVSDLENSLRKGVPDFAYMNPLHLVTVYPTQKYIPLVASAKNKLQGVLVVRKDSPIKSLRDLRNADIAFPSPNAFAGSLLLRAHLAREGIKFNPQYVRTHENVYRSVVFGSVSAGGGITTTLDREPEELRGQLRILFTSEEYPPQPFSAHPRVPENVRKPVIDAFLSINTTEAGKASLHQIQITQPVTVDYRRDYAALEKLRLEKFMVPGEN